MRESPETGARQVGLGLIRKNVAQVFKMPVLPSLSGERLPRSMRVTLTWFSPVDPSRAQYRLAALEAAALNEADDGDDGRWGFDMTSDGLDANIIKRGSVWSKRLKNRIQTIPEFDEDADIPIRVQCRDASGGKLSQDDDIMFAIAVTLQLKPKSSSTSIRRSSKHCVSVSARHRPDLLHGKGDIMSFGNAGQAIGATRPETALPFP